MEDKMRQRKNICVWLGQLCCAAEMDTTLSINYTLTYKKVIWKTHWDAPWEGLCENHRDAHKPNILLRMLSVLHPPVQILLFGTATQGNRISTPRFIRAWKQGGWAEDKRNPRVYNPEDSQWISHTRMLLTLPHSQHLRLSVPGCSSDRQVSTSSYHLGLRQLTCQRSVRGGSCCLASRTLMRGRVGMMGVKGW